MSRTEKWVAEYLWANLGHCSLCTRKAFLSAAAAWIVTVVLSATLEQSVWLPMSEICAGLLTALWLAHILAFAIKSSRSRLVRENFNSERRAVFLVFAKIAAIAVLASAVPSLSYAQSCGVIGACPSGTTCCSKNCPSGKTANACCKNCYATDGSCIVPC